MNKALMFEADAISGMDDLREQFPAVPALPMDDPLYSYGLDKARDNNRLPARILDDSFIKAVSGADDVVDDCGFPVLMQKSAPTLTLAQRAAQAISKSVNAVFPRVEFITKSASGRTAKIAEILDQTKQALSAKGYKPDGWDGWKALSKHADEFVISVLMEA